MDTMRKVDQQRPNFKFQAKQKSNQMENQLILRNERASSEHSHWR